MDAWPCSVLAVLFELDDLVYDALITTYEKAEYRKSIDMDSDASRKLGALSTSTVAHFHFRLTLTRPDKLIFRFWQFVLFVLDLTYMVGICAPPHASSYCDSLSPHRKGPVTLTSFTRL